MSSLIVLSHSVMSKSCNSIVCSLPSSSVHGILQARILEWLAISFSRGSSEARNWTRVSRIAGRLFTDWTTREVWLNEFNFAGHPQKLTLNVIWGINANYLGTGEPGGLLSMGPHRVGHDWSNLAAALRYFHVCFTNIISFHLYRNLWYIYVLLSFGDKYIEPQTSNLIKFF